MKKKNEEPDSASSKKSVSHKTTSYNSQTNNFIGPSGESKTISGNAIISGKDLLMMALVRFYKQNSNQNMYRIIPIIEGNCNISLRLIDWFVTNYSKKFNTIVIRSVKGIDGIEYCNVYISYRQQLKAFSKQQFDPFRRRDRIRFVYDKDNNWVETTIGQLNFFKWVLQNNILDFIIHNLEAIEADMITSQNNMKQIDKNTAEKKSYKNKINTDRVKGDLTKKKMKEEESGQGKGGRKIKNQTEQECSSSVKGKKKQNRVQLTRTNNQMMSNNDTRIGTKIVIFD